ncbi:MAG: metallophosphoesterase [Acidobacteria bacterium]|nr:metallophosphoesterase [Acidobacteriota bacterium]
MSCPCFFASDLHGSHRRYQSLWTAAAEERPKAIFLGGDLLPGVASPKFIRETIESEVLDLQQRLGPDFPQIFLIPGNDDAAADFAAFDHGENLGLWRIIHNRHDHISGRSIFGYGCVPPTPFMLKDWERYDVSRYVDPGSLSPEEGHRTVSADADEIRFGTIAEDLKRLAGKEDLADSVWLFHSPPYQTNLDRAALDGRSIDHVPLDVNVGSIAIRRFIETRQPLVTLHGHIHESARLTGHWREQLGRTWMLSAAHDGSELALVRIDPDQPEAASRQLV